MLRPRLAAGTTFLRYVDIEHQEISSMKHLLPPLPYAVSALEPHIAAHTMSLHHGQHHDGYVKALSLALKWHGIFSGQNR